MTEPRHCPRCQAPLPADAPERICPACQLRAALEPDVEGTPSLAELAAAPNEGEGTVIGRYKLLQKIGEGGFRVVYMVTERVSREMDWIAINDLGCKCDAGLDRKPEMTLSFKAPSVLRPQYN